MKAAGFLTQARSRGLIRSNQGPAFGASARTIEGVQVLVIRELVAAAITKFSCVRRSGLRIHADSANSSLLTQLNQIGR